MNYSVALEVPMYAIVRLLSPFVFAFALSSVAACGAPEDAVDAVDDEQEQAMLAPDSSAMCPGGITKDCSRYTDTTQICFYGCWRKNGTASFTCGMETQVSPTRLEIGPCDY
jgi:hypothetical protein